MEHVVWRTGWRMDHGTCSMENVHGERENSYYSNPTTKITYYILHSPSSIFHPPMPHFSFLPKENAVLPDLAFRWPGRYAPMLRYTHKILRGKSALSVAERELIGAYVSLLNACNFCYSVHSALAEQFGVQPEVLEALKNDIDSAPVSDKLKPVLKYVKKVTETPSQVVKEDIDAILAAGWPEKAAVDALSIAAAFAAWNRLMDGAGIPAIPYVTRVKTTSFMRKLGYMPWFMYPMFRIWGIFKNPK